MSEVKVLKPYIGGQYVASKTEKYTDAFNPSTGEVIAKVPCCLPEEVEAAVAAAGEAGELTKLPDNAMMRMFLNPMPINSLPTLLGEGGKKIAQFMVDEYAKLAK